MTKEQAETIFNMHKELVAFACIQSGRTDPPTFEDKMRWRRKELAFKRYLENLIGDYMIIPIGKENTDGSFGSNKEDS